GRVGPVPRRARGGEVQVAGAAGGARRAAADRDQQGEEERAARPDGSATGGERMTTKLDGGLRGVDHVAYVTRNPKETLHFYRDVLGFPLVHCIVAPGWGKDPHPDFLHFFFDIGNGAKLAFFYYLAEPGVLDGDL